MSGYRQSEAVGSDVLGERERLAGEGQAGILNGEIAEAPDLFRLVEKDTAARNGESKANLNTEIILCLLDRILL